jgi:hypothetical protein
MNEPLRPSTLGEILDRTAHLYRRNFLLFAGTAALPSAVIVGVLAVLLSLWGGARVAGAGIHSPALLVLLIGTIVLAVPLWMGATVVSQAALTRAAISAQLGNKLKIREALRTVWPRFWRYLWALVLQGIFVVFFPASIAGVVITLLILLPRMTGESAGAGVLTGAFMFIVIFATAIWIVFRMLTYCLVLPACVAEEKTAWLSLKRSTKLSRGTRGRILLMFLLVWVLSVVVSMVAYIPMMIAIVVVGIIGHGARNATVLMAVAEMVNVLINFSVQSLIAPVYVMALVLFYFDQRVRNEGYDIEWMMQQGGLTDAPAMPGPGQFAAQPAADPNTGNG